MRQELIAYYHAAYAAVRAHSDTVVVVFCVLYWFDYWAWVRELREPDHFNVALDMHLPLQHAEPAAWGGDAVTAWDARPRARACSAHSRSAAAVQTVVAACGVASSPCPRSLSLRLSTLSYAAFDGFTATSPDEYLVAAADAMNCKLRAHEYHHPLLVGEWALSSGGRVPVQDFVDGQFGAFEHALGWFFWTLKTQRRSWSQH